MLEREKAVENAIKETTKEVRERRRRSRVGLSRDRVKNKTAPDRLNLDKEYLIRLSEFASTSSNSSRVDRRVSRTAREALRLLNARDEFWRQVDPSTARGSVPGARTHRLDFDKISRLS